MHLVLLPGMDGTGQLFEPFVRALPGECQTTQVAYPPNVDLGYSELLPYVREQLPHEPYVVVAESFSGPLGVVLAAEQPALLKGLILCSSFVRNPLPPTLGWLKLFVSSRLFRRPPSAWVVRLLLVGNSAPVELVEAVRNTVSSVEPEVLAGRLHAILQVEVSSILSEISVPKFYLASSADRLVGGRGVEQVKQACSDIEVFELRGPHFLLQACPAEAASVIVGLCAGIEVS